MNMRKILMRLLFSLVISGFSVLQAQQMITVHPNEYSGALSNPLKGFRPDRNDWNKYEYPTLVRDYIRWNQIENSATDGVDKIVDFCNSRWAGLQDANIKVIPRVYLDWDSNSGNEYWPADLEKGDWYSDEFKQRVVNMIYKLGEVWDNDPRVAWVQTGIIGYWGEQENPVGVDDDGWVERMGKAFKAAFPNKLLVVRNQNHWDAKGYEWGVYWDSFAHPGQKSGSWTWIRAANAKGRYLTHPVEGEVAYNWGTDVLYPLIGSGPNETLANPKYYNYLIDVIRELHCSGLGWIASYSPNNSNVLEGAMKVQKAFGYRFEINEFTIADRSEPGGNLEFTAKIINTGSAPFYEKWPLAFVLVDSSSHEIVWTKVLKDVDITTWRPGNDYDYDNRIYSTPAEEYFINKSITVPSDLAPGRYMAGLTILEPFSRTPGLFFAVKNFLEKSQTQPLCWVGIGQDVVGGHEIDSTLFDDPLLDDHRYYTLEWNGPTYSLTTSAAAGGSVSPTSGIFRENQKVRVEAVAELGYEFSGWSGDYSGAENPVVITMDSDKSLIANFSQVPTYKLSVNIDTTAGSIVLTPSGGVYNEGTVVTLEATPQLGYRFNEWSGDLSGADNPTTITMDADKNVTANFESIPVYTLTTNASGGTIELDPPGLQYNEGTQVKVTAIPNPGYLFYQWSGDPLDYASYINPNFITMDADKYITAEFMADPTAGNLIKNGDFSAGLNKWSPQVISPAQAKISVVNKECKIDIQAVSNEEWHVNILQPGIQLESNVSYTLSFDARATKAKTVSAKAQFDHDPWTSSLEEPVDITTTMQRYHVTWLQKEPADYYKVGLFFGSDTTNVWVDNFELKPSTTGVKREDENSLPQHTQLGQNYPNPFNPETTIPYELNKRSHVKVTIYNAIGQQVKTLVDEPQVAGYHSAKWIAIDANGTPMASGIYFYQLETDNHSIQTKKFLLLQ